MKRYIYILSAMLLALTACESNLEKTVYDSEKAVPAVLQNLASTSYTLEANKEDNEAIAFAWTKPDYGYSAAFTSNVEMALKGTSFANAVVLASLKTDTAYSITVKELNNKIITLLETEGQDIATADFEFRIASSISTAASALYSNVVAATITPYSGEREYPKVWVIGDYCGWSHDSSQFLFSFGENTTYEGIVDFGEKAANGFKITGVGNWNDATKNWGRDNSQAVPDSEANSITLIAGGGSDNLTCYAKRFYHFTFDTSTLVLKKDYSFSQLGVIGLNGDWNNDVVMSFDTSAQRFYADVEVTAACEFKFRTDASWTKNWGGSDGNLNSDKNIAIAAGNYRIYAKLNNSSAPTYEISTKDYGK